MEEKASFAVIKSALCTVISEEILAQVIMTLRAVEAGTARHDEGPDDERPNWESVDDLGIGQGVVIDDFAGDLVTHHARGCEGDLTFENMEVRVTDAAGFGADEELAGLGTRDLEELEREGAGGIPEHSSLHGRRRADVIPSRGGGGG